MTKVLRVCSLLVVVIAFFVVAQGLFGSRSETRDKDIDICGQRESLAKQSRFKEWFQSPFENLFHDFITNVEEPASDYADKLMAKKLPLDIHEKDDWYEVTCDIPGIKKEDIQIDVDDNYLKISTERKFDKNHEDNKYYRHERYRGKLFRSLRLPDNVDVEKLTANLNDGVLTIKIGKLPSDKAKVLKSIAVE
jgi:HSP20 family protein